MNWYYTKEGQQVGPVSDFRLREMAAAKEITPETLVWEKGMTDWRKAEEVRPDWFVVQPVAEETIQALLSSQSPPPLPKPMTPQRPTAQRLLARLLAKFFDAFLVYMVLVIILSPELEQLKVPTDFEGMRVRLAEDETFREQMFAFQSKFAMYFMGALFALQVVGLSLIGATPGKWILGLRVIQQDGQRLSLQSTLIRALSDLVNYLLCGGLSYLWVLFDRQGYGLHDHLAKTQVVHKKDAPKS